jgi:hypothetical protein
LGQSSYHWSKLIKAAEALGRYMPNSESSFLISSNRLCRF